MAEIVGVETVIDDGKCETCANWNGGEIVGECRLAAENMAKYEESGEVEGMAMFAAPLLTQRWFGCNQHEPQH